MPRKPMQNSRRGQANKGPIFMLAGLSDIVMAGVMWFMIGQGDMVISLVCAFMALVGLGITGYGLITMLRNV